MRVLLVGAEVSGGLSNLPVIGPHVPPDAVRLRGLYAAAANRGLGPDEAAKVNALLGAVDHSGTGPRVPAEGLTGTLQLGVDVHVGDRDLILTATGGKGTAARTGLGNDTAITWYAVGRSLGPVRLDRLGVQYSDHRVWLLLDAGISGDALTISAQGMGLGIGLTQPPTVEARLDGLGLAWDRSPIKISGALLNRHTPNYLIDVEGAAAVITPALSLGAVGGYAQPLTGEPSVFVYGQLAFKEGEGIGPPPFRITGAAAGFGYNSAVRVPEAGDVEKFPFMPGNAQGVTTDPLEYLEKLTGGSTPWVTRTPGRMWLAAGLQFDSFEFLHGRALALVQFAVTGRTDFTATLLGQVGAQFPVAPATAYANVALDVMASYTSSEDTLEIYAAIDPASFLVHHSCHLTGSAALRLWFGNSAHPGDFVLAAGGYGPGYDKPDHYPDVQPIGLSWSVSDHISVRGSCYAALVPSSFRVGGRLDVSFEAGPISAGLHASLDAMVQRDPFYFRVSIHVDVWVEVDLWVATLRGSFGVGLDLWGPPTGGIASVHALGRSFDIRFGEDPPVHQPRLSWQEFTERLLPRPVAHVVAERGLLPGVPPSQAATMRRQPAMAQGPEPWTLSPHGFGLLTRTAIPANQLRVADAEGHWQKVPSTSDRAAIKIRPMGVDGADSTHQIAVQRDTHGYNPLSPDAAWVFTPVEGKVPEGLWGTPITDAGPGASTGEALIDAWTGVRVTTPEPRLSDNPVTATENAVAAPEQITGPPMPLPTQQWPGIGPDHATRVRHSIADPAGGITASVTTSAREDLCLALDRAGVPVLSEGRPALRDPLVEYREHLRDHLRSEPLWLSERP
ncbi:DUF6603 domain-containing protein [Streptomyces tsukubensis]|uniref:DUF6603 domain-containing protein n=1 Tax=Streptomyces tsukubensis TaxID=83656 RepID=A0A1V3ZY80_9ACTN|nr:DUF6603 domain-containing protein [Streptomyces tsukubensis]OON71344.1 hypothetical protein B1H18_34260 [Streptomyces tsukubensis]QFR96685.1 hypothetical protein GBW32_31200 [Streptomyces tsukubensis]